jgi:NADH-quinone oxidoreductase subunit L
MIGLVFFGNKSKHVEEMEKEGHHIHEASPTMWIPYGILAVLTIGIGVIGLTFEHQIHDLFVNYLGTTFGIKSNLDVVATESQSIFGGFLQGVNPVALIASLSAFAIGFILGYIFYIGRFADPVKFVNSNIFFYAIHKFFLNRWYLNAIIYWTFVVAPLYIARGLYKYFENFVLEGFNVVPEKTMAGGARIMQATQTGVSQSYLYIFGVGILIVVFLLLI